MCECWPRVCLTSPQYIWVFIYTYSRKRRMSVGNAIFKKNPFSLKIKRGRDPITVFDRTSLSGLWLRNPLMPIFNSWSMELLLGNGVVGPMFHVRYETLIGCLSSTQWFTCGCVCARVVAQRSQPKVVGISRRKRAVVWAKLGSCSRLAQFLEQVCLAKG